ncbi:hypothetical protein IX53_01820 [Kosmotoga pacifica]|uniref:Uncharacterized protein n=1 Tax=Kosmotoga pacifica TaxID=1330330 RepID=A0A0G2ZB02_9BACT|nr:hypothetical protein IX53_01820 [Kosmotoga pacifica]
MFGNKFLEFSKTKILLTHPEVAIHCSPISIAVEKKIQHLTSSFIHYLRINTNDFIDGVISIPKIYIIEVYRFYVWPEMSYSNNTIIFPQKLPPEAGSPNLPVSRDG